MDRIPDSGTTKDIRNLVKSVFIPALPKDSRARKIAEEADDPANADSFLRGKADAPAGIASTAGLAAPTGVEPVFPD